MLKTPYFYLTFMAFIGHKSQHFVLATETPIVVKSRTQYTNTVIQGLLDLWYSVSGAFAANKGDEMQTGPFTHLENSPEGADL